MSALLRADRVGEVAPRIPRRAVEGGEADVVNGGVDARGLVHGQRDGLGPARPHALLITFHVLDVSGDVRLGGLAVPFATNEESHAGLGDVRLIRETGVDVAR